MVKVATLAYRLERFLGRSDISTRTLDDHVELVLAFVRAYTRGQGFPEPDDGTLPDDLAAVVVTATARLVTNPAQLEREHAGEYVAVGSFAGWTLPELAVLHRYRRRTA